MNRLRSFIVQSAGIWIFLSLCILDIGCFDNSVSPPSVSSIKIVFGATVSESLPAHIFTVTDDGKELRQLTHGDSLQSDPSFSPDGKQIVFTSQKGEAVQLYVMESDGRNIRRIETGIGSAMKPEWSPDGKKILFLRLTQWVAGGTICTVDPDGLNYKNLTPTSTNNGGYRWSPNGSMIAFISARDNNNELYVMNADGTNERRLTDTPTIDESDISWSGDGSAIYFSVYNSSQRMSDLYSLRLSDLKKSRLTVDTTSQYAAYTQSSPDGKKIAYVSTIDQNSEIYVMDSDGTGHKNLSKSPDYEFLPSWSRDSRRILYVSIHDTKRSLYVMNADGFSRTKIVENLWFTAQPRW